MKIRTVVILAAIAASVLPAAAQFDMGESVQAKPAWSSFKLPNKKVKLEFRNANPDLVLNFLSKASGITIVKDPALKEPISVSTPKAVSLDEAFQVVDALLKLKNYDLRKEGNLLVVKARPQQTQEARPQFTPEMMQMMAGGGQARTELRVYPIKHANASQVARVINEVFTSQDQMNNPLQQMMSGMGGMSFQIGGGRRGSRFGGASSRGGSTVRASSDDYSNSVIVNAPRDEHEQVQELIEQIDKVTEEPNQSKVFKLQFAIAQEIAPVVQNVLTNNAPKGRGGAGNQNIPFEQRFQQAFRFGSTQAAFGTVTADARTNSLVVSATQENLAVVEKVIAELDTEVKLETSTFVFPLDNARADSMANLLTQAFGSRAGGGSSRTNGGTTGNNNRTNRTMTGGVRFGGGGGFQGARDANALELDLADPNIDAGELQTNVDVQGGIFFGGGGGAGRQQTTATQGRDAQGRLINVQDLTNQVTVIPDPNTNSLIVVTNPENAEIIRQILGQLDKIPEQVMIETIIVEATLDKSSKLGVEWTFAQDKAFGNTGTTGSAGTNFGLGTATTGFKYSLTGGNLTALMNALQTDQKFQVLSTPRIFTSNNVEAQINISQRVPFVVSQREDANGNLTFNYDFEDVGIVLTVTPRITANGYVTMDVEQTANDLQGFTTFNAPIVNQRQANTTVAVKDGETIILGGIIRSTVTSTVRKVPLLGDIPILGNLFKSTDKSNQKTELLVFLTPRVVRNPEEAKKLLEAERQKLSKQSQDALKKAQAGNGTDKKDGNGQ